MTNHPNNALLLGYNRSGLLMQDYDKEDGKIYPLHDGKRIQVDDNDVITLKNEFILGTEGIMSSLIQLYKDYEIKQIEFELFCDVIMKEGENELFRRCGTMIVCKRLDMYQMIMSKISEHTYDEVVLEYPVDNLHEMIMKHPILSKNYIGTVNGDGITYVIFEKIDNIQGLDMGVYEMLFSGQIWYDFSNIIDKKNISYISERFIFAYEIITGTTDPYMEGYDGLRITSKHLINIRDMLNRLEQVMGEFDIITSTTLLDALRVRYRYYDMQTRIFRSGPLYVTLIHGYTKTRSNNVDALIQSDVISHLQSCKNDEDPVSLEKFTELDLLDLIHIVPYDEDGFKFCFSDEYDLNINPYTRRSLSTDAIKQHYHSLFTRPIVV